MDDAQAVASSAAQRGARAPRPARLVASWRQQLCNSPHISCSAQRRCSVGGIASLPAVPCLRVTPAHARLQEEPEPPGAHVGAGACARAAAGASGGSGSGASPGSSGLGPPTPCPAAEAPLGFPACESQASCASSACQAHAEPDSLAAARTDLVGVPAQAATCIGVAAAPLHAGDTARAALPGDLDTEASSGCHTDERGAEAHTPHINDCMMSGGGPGVPAAGCLADARVPAASSHAPGSRDEAAEAAAQQRQQREAARRARQAERDAEEAAAAPRVRAFFASGGFSAVW